MMKNLWQHADGSKSYSFYCGTYKRSGKNYCTPHTLPFQVLNDIVLGDLKQIISNVENLQELVKLQSFTAPKIRKSTDIELTRRGFRIVGVSPDSEKSHRNFCAKHDLNFTLLADTDHSVCEAYGVWAEKSMYGRKYMGVLRTTFVIDAEGRIEQVFTKVDTKNHYQQILDAYK